VKTGWTKSCGCIKGEVQRKKREDRESFIGETQFNQLIKNYKNGAKKRGLVFKLSNDEMYEIVTKDCYYCGQEPSQIIGGVHRFYYNGIDRVDNSKGYIKSNCKPACKTCNIMKRQLSKNDFLEHINKIFKKQYGRL